MFRPELWPEIVPVQLRRLIKVLGAALQLAAAVFLAWMLWRYLPAILALDVGTPGLVFIGVAGGLLSMAILGLIGMGWRELIATGAPPPARLVLWITGRTSIAKYLPSNMLHYAGRQIFAPSLGVSQARVLASSIAEVLCVIGANGLITLLAVASAGRLPSGWPPTPLLVLAAGACMLAPVGPMLAARLIRDRLPKIAPLLDVRWPALVRSFCLYGGAMALGAVSFVMVMAVLGGLAGGARIGGLVAAYACSYVVGFVTPGSPGGLGVRETALVLLTAGMAEPSLVLGAALLQRVTLILGEAAAFGLTLTVPGPPMGESPEADA